MKDNPVLCETAQKSARLVSPLVIVRNFAPFIPVTPAAA